MKGFTRTTQLAMVQLLVFFAWGALFGADDLPPEN